MAIASFDPSITHLGWVIFDETKTGKGAVLEAGVFKTRPADGLLVQRLITQRERMKLLLTKWDINFVSMEAPYWQDFNTELLFALNQHLHEAFLDLGVFVIYVQPNTAKRYALPKMKMADITKHHITHKAKKELGLMGRVFSEHIADAYFVGKIGLKFYQWYFMKKFKDSDLSEYENKLFCGKHTFKKGLKKGLTEYTGLIYRENDQFFDYRKQKRDSKKIMEEIRDGGEESFHSGRLFKKVKKATNTRRVSVKSKSRRPTNYS